MRYISPLVMRQVYFEPIEKIIRNIFNDAIYIPLMAVLKNKDIQNTKLTAVEDALTKGSIWYDDNRLFGHFSAAISRELKELGAVYSARKQSWLLPSLPTPGMQMAIALAESNRSALLRRMISTLDSVDIDKIIKEADLQGAFNKTIGKIDAEFVKKTVSIAIRPTLSATQRDIMAKQWATNLDLYIRKWAENEILSLRQVVATNTLRGGRAESIEKHIQTRYGVSKSKAKFLARQETSLCMATFQESRFKEVGVRRYRWSGADDERERPDHKLLNGKIFFFDSPPISNRKTGARNNPGSDWGCRCVSVPIVE